MRKWFLIRILLGYPVLLDHTRKVLHLFLVNDAVEVLEYLHHPLYADLIISVQTASYKLVKPHSLNPLSFSLLLTSPVLDKVHCGHDWCLHAVNLITINPSV